MRIISKTKDFYDAAHMGEDDPKRIFNRPEPSIINDKGVESIRMYNIRAFDWRYRYELKFNVIGFCGEIYPVITLKNSCRWDEPINKYQDNPVCAYNLEDFKTLYSQHIQKNGMELDEETFSRVENWFNKKGISSKYGRNGKTQFIDFPDLKYIFLKYKVVYFMVRISEYSSDDDRYKNRLVLYPYLNHFEFNKVFNALECYQKIDMYLFNQLVPPDVVIHKVPDKIKAESHGFNKFSFRKDKVIDKV